MSPVYKTVSFFKETSNKRASLKLLHLKYNLLEQLKKGGS